MEIHFHEAVPSAQLNRIEEKLDVLLQRTRRIIRQGVDMNQAVENIARETQETATVIDSAVTFISGIRTELQAVKDELAAQGIDNERLNGLSAGLDESQTKLAAAIATTPTGEPAPIGDVPPAEPTPA